MYEEKACPQQSLGLFFQDDADAAKSELDQIKALRDRGAVFCVNHSAGKDSQAMFLNIIDLVPREQIFVVHALLPGVEWSGVLEHIQATTMGLTVHTCRARRTLLEMIKERGMFPSPSIRNCTSDLKRGPIERTIRGFVEARIRSWVGRGPEAKIGTQERVNALAAGMGLVVNCMGMRADESPNRAKLKTLKFNEANSKNGREWYDWLPIHHNTVDEVFAKIAAAGQKPHPAYALGMSRLSCCFCIMASKEDLTIAAQHNPRMYRQYVDLEHSTGQVMLMPKTTKGTVIKLTLEQVTGIKAKSYEELDLMAA